MALDMAFKSVVLPEPVPPETSTLTRASTQAARKSNISGVSERFLSRAADRQRSAAEAANGDQGPVQRQRRHDRVHAAAVRQAGVDHGRRFVDPPAHPARHPVNDGQHVGRVDELHVGEFQPAMAFDIDRIRTVDQDIADFRVFEQGLQRPQTEHLVQHFADQRLALVLVEQVLPLPGEPLGNPLHFDLQLILGHRADGREIQRADDLLVQLPFDLQQVCAETSAVCPFPLR